MAEPTVTFTHRLGRFELGPSEILHFGGLPGFPRAERFALLRHDRESTFLWLVCLDDPELAFAVADPRQFFPDYAPRIPSAQLEALEAAGTDALELFSIATVRDGAATLNLAAPVVVNAGRGKGTQVILETSEHSTREPLPAPNAPDADATAAQIESKPHR